MQTLQRPHAGATDRLRRTVLLIVVFAPLAALMLAVPAIPQDPAYHVLADSRTVWGVRNFGNVVSNLPFLLVGAAGLLLCIRGQVEGARRAWTVFFAGTLLVAFGSAYYHDAPGNATLVWDRLPMTLAFMAFFVAFISEHAGEALERKLLVPALAAGAASVAWWNYSGDLRPYVWVQFAPLAAILYTLAVFPPRYSHRAYFVYGLVCYILAKVAEFLDWQILAATSGAISGHSLKHLLAALAPLFIYLMLRVRLPRRS